MFGLNLAINDPQVPSELALAAEQIIGRDKLISFELGNEPDIYHVRGLYVQNGEVVRPRPDTYNPAQHTSEFSSHREAIRAFGVRTPLAGPGIGMSNLRWMKQLPNSSGRSAAVSERWRCMPIPSPPVRDTGQPVPHAGNLLEAGLMAVNGQRLFDAVRLARRGGARKIRITETNSATCGGIKGASDVMAGALWTLDWSFTMLLGGATGINYHASPAFYRPFSAGWHEGAWKVSPAAPLYAHLMFAEAMPAGARLSSDDVLRGAAPQERQHQDLGHALQGPAHDPRRRDLQGRPRLRPGSPARARGRGPRDAEAASAPTWSSTYEKVSYAGRQSPGPEHGRAAPRS